MSSVLLFLLIVVGFPFLMILIIKLSTNLGLMKGESREEMEKRKERAAKYKETKDLRK